MSSICAKVRAHKQAFGELYTVPDIRAETHTYKVTYICIYVYTCIQTLYIYIYVYSMYLYIYICTHTYAHSRLRLSTCPPSLRRGMTSVDKATARPTPHPLKDPPSPRRSAGNWGHTGSESRDFGGLHVGFHFGLLGLWLEVRGFCGLHAVMPYVFAFWLTASAPKCCLVAVPLLGSSSKFPEAKLTQSPSPPKQNPSPIACVLVALFT